MSSGRRCLAACFFFVPEFFGGKERGFERVFFFFFKRRVEKGKKKAFGVCEQSRTSRPISPSPWKTLPGLTFDGSIAMPTRLRIPGASDSGAGAEKVAADGAMGSKKERSEREVSQSCEEK